MNRLTYAVALLTLSGCGKGGDTSSQTHSESYHQASTAKQEFVYTEESVGRVKGEELFRSNCAICHGPKALGIDGPGSSLGAANLHKELEAHPNDWGHLVEEILEGKGAMPSWQGRLSIAEINGILEYVDSLVAADRER